LKEFKEILIITSEFPPQPGGIGNHAFNLALQLSFKNYNVVLIADHRSQNYKEDLLFDNSLPFKVFRIKRYRFLILTYFRRILLYRQFIKNGTRIIATGKFPLWMVGLDIFTKRAKKIAVIHGTEVNFSGIKRMLTNFSLKRFNKIITVSNYTKSLIESLKLSNVNIIFNGFNLSSTKDLNLDKKKISLKRINLITIGKVSERKGQLNVIKAIPKLLERGFNLHYHIVGVPQNQHEFEIVADQLGVLDCITFHGSVSEEEKEKLLDASNLFFMLSNETSSGDVEGFGIAIIEANALGIPAIGAKNCGIEDAIKNKYSGILVNPLNDTEITLAVEEIMNNYEKYSFQAESWSKQFMWENVIENYIKVLDK